MDFFIIYQDDFLCVKEGFKPYNNRSPYRGTHYYILTGTQNEVEKWCNYLFNVYHPAGYGTTLTSTKTVGDGVVEWNVLRASSSD